MRYYHSLLSIGAILLIILGIWILIAMIKGAYPTSLVFIFPLLGFILLFLDKYIRKSKLKIKNKIFIQITILSIVMLGFFLLT